MLQRLVDLARRKAVVVGGVALAAFAAGSGTGFIYARNKLEAKYAGQVAEEVAKARDYYKRLYKAEEYSNPITAEQALVEQDAEATRQAVIDAADALDSYRPQTEEPKGEIRVMREPVGAPPRVIHRNLFDEAAKQPVDFDYEDEVKERRSDIPYIISAEEFEDSSLMAACLTYYEGDGVLADSQDTMIEQADIPKTVGSLANLRFGHRSNDNNVVYVRSELLDMDFEVVRSEGKYGEEVAGFVSVDDEPTQVGMAIPTFRGDQE